MKFQYACGNLIYDGGDDLPHKAHVIPDQRWNALFEAVDEVIEHRCATAEQRNAACTKVRALVVETARLAWQCSTCGRLHLDDAAPRVQSFTPETPDMPRDLFRTAR